MPPTAHPQDLPDAWLGRCLHFLLRHAGWGLWITVLVLAAMSRATFLLRCESFGCTFVGVVWIAIAGIWLLALLVGAGLRWRQRQQALSTRTSDSALAVLVLAGAGHLVYWLA